MAVSTLLAETGTRAEGACLPASVCVLGRSRAKHATLPASLSGSTHDHQTERGMTHGA